MIKFLRVCVHDHDIATQKYVLPIVMFLTVMLWAANSAPALADEALSKDYPMELRPVKMALSSSKVKVCRMEEKTPVSPAQNKTARDDKNAPHVIMADSVMETISAKTSLDVLQMGKPIQYKPLPSKAALRKQALLKQQRAKDLQAKTQARQATKPALIKAHDLPANVAPVLPAQNQTANQVANQPFSPQRPTDTTALSAPATPSPQMANTTPVAPQNLANNTAPALVKTQAPEATASVAAPAANLRKVDGQNQAGSAAPLVVRPKMPALAAPALPNATSQGAQPHIPLPSDFE